jgi:hypothetical protein
MSLEVLPRTRGERLLRYPSAVLLAIQVVAMAVYPFVGTTELGRAVVSLIGTLVLGFAIWTIRQARGRVIPALVLGAIALTWSVVAIFLTDDWVVVTSGVAHGLFYLYTAYALVEYLFGDDWVTRDDLFAVGAAFTVLAWGFTYIFSVIQAIEPLSFNAFQGPGERSWFELLTLSFANLTNTGLSDIAPVRSNARAWTMIEQLVGVMYIAMVISRLVALGVRRAR